MKVSVKYTKHETGDIIACITVVDREDFPQNQALDHRFGVKTIQGINQTDMFSQTTRDNLTPQVSRQFPDSEEARKWVEAVMAWMEKELKRWRDIKLPESYQVEV